MNSPAPRSAHGSMRALALILLPILGIALVVAVIFSTKSKEKAAVTVVYTENQPGAAAINTGDVVDATIPDVIIVPQMGYRYKVFVDDESDDRSSGIAKIGGMITFIPGARPGQTAIVDVTRVRERVVDAVIVKVLSQIEMAPRIPRGPFVPPPGDPAGHVIAGAEMDVIISEASSKNPTTEGVAKVNGLVVFVNGATTIGERVNVRITDRRARLAFAEPTGKPAGTDPIPASGALARTVFQPQPGDPVVIGAEMDVVISEASSKNPTTDGVARVGGLVVVVNGVPAIGERVNVRITERLERVAFAEPSGKPAGTGPLASTGSTGETLRRTFAPGVSDPAANVIAGAEMDVIISEASSKNPTTEGVARVNGLVVFVAGATTIGERVNIRITARRETVAFAELSGKPAGTDPLPAPAAPTRPARASFVPPPGDSAPHVVPGAVIAATITENSQKNPTTEGVTRINGLVVFVRGATTIGQAVNVRIVERRERIAIGEVTTDAPTPLPAPIAPVAAPVPVVAAPVVAPAPAVAPAAPVAPAPATPAP